MAMPKTETKDIWKSTYSNGTNLNPIFGGCVLVASGVACNIQRGSRGAKEMAMALGRNPDLSSAGFFNVADQGNLASDYFLVGGSDPVMRIIGRPEVRSRFPQTAHVKVLLEDLNYKPDGIP